MPELVVGVLVMSVFALGAVLWHLSAVDRSPALAVVGTVERGDVISSDDLRVVYVSSDDALARMSESQMTEVVGRVALVDLAPGTLVTRSVVADRPTLEEGEGIVGLSLDPGGYPDLGLAPGDRVTIVRSGDTAVPEATDDSADDGETSSNNVIAREATVVSVEELTGDRRLVSVLTTEADAQAVAAAAGSGSLRLVQVSP
ncbi:hypothetical protein HC251_04545 [Iamia sp. SCSIO 61187]|uniref:SAF domain-containing protein n=1 Tax=Iamia sp. SCSIO 61187 TaxID=2722752 RepID=UPI001C631A94|nr:SAF domain-containing protein [Iamia sp. SCSIO 61187]QYG91779.1 hypothetical protein HC251_04545 [Iamia sp. SCSIO 61187]